MTVRTRMFEEAPVFPLLDQRQKLGFGRYIKTAKRNGEKRRVLIAFYLDLIRRREKDDFILVGPRRRRLKAQGMAQDSIA